jgi:hypothetical protein
VYEFCAGKNVISVSAERVLVIVCPDAQRNAGILACAKLNIQNFTRTAAQQDSRVHIILMVNLV